MPDESIRFVVGEILKLKNQGEPDPNASKLSSKLFIAIPLGSHRSAQLIDIFPSSLFLFCANSDVTV